MSIDSPEPTIDDGWHRASLVAGLALLAVACSGALRNSGLIPHHPALVFLVLSVAAALAVSARSVRRLAQSS